jgi:DNA-binding IclR family transcriptional regulator
MARPAASQTTILDWTAAEKIMDALAAAPAGLDAQSVADRTGAALSVVKARLAELKAEGFIDARKVPGSRSFLYTLVRRPKVA